MSEREVRSFPRLLASLESLTERIVKLTVHVRAACSIVGIPSDLDDAKSTPEPGEETAPMLLVLEKVEALERLVEGIDLKFTAALGELIPAFYEDHLEKRPKR